MAFASGHKATDSERRFCFFTALSLFCDSSPSKPHSTSSFLSVTAVKSPLEANTCGGNAIMY